VAAVALAALVAAVVLLLVGVGVHLAGVLVVFIALLVCAESGW
jgi:hypothetical protein